MNYEAWRATHQDAEAAAKAAFEQVQGLAKMVDGLQGALGAQVRFGGECVLAAIAVQAQQATPTADMGNTISQDTKIVDFLAKNYIGVDFRWGEPTTEVIIIEMPRGCRYSGDFRKDVATAMAPQAQQGGAA